MLSALKKLLGTGAIPKAIPGASPTPAAAPQLELGFVSAPLHTAEQLLARLRTLGLRRISALTLTRNRNVMVSFKGSQLRVHAGFLNAPESVHRAIVTFVEGRTRAERRGAQKVIVTHPIEVAQRTARRERMHEGDAPSAAKLEGWHHRYNARHFDGALKPIRVRVSRRMKSRLGHYSTAAAGEPAEIAISRRHLRRHGWQEALHTLLHEMVHQWQDETQRTIDHGAAFRAKAREVGIAPYARRALTEASRLTSASSGGHTSPDIAASGQRDSSVS